MKLEIHKPYFIQSYGRRIKCNKTLMYIELLIGKTNQLILLDR